VAKEKAEKEEAEREKSQGNEVVAMSSENHETIPMSNQGHDDDVAPIALDSSLSNVIHAIGNRIQKKKQFMFPSVNSSMIEPKHSLHVFVKCTSLIILLNSLQEPIGPHPQ